jgi:DNA-binding PadR family transcriptional regulator
MPLTARRGGLIVVPYINYRYINLRHITESTCMPKRDIGQPPAESYLPLPPATFQILLALVDDERHGYAIMKEVDERTDGTLRIGPGTLYGTLKRLLEAGLVEEGVERADPELENERRRYYRLTRFGLAVARAEARRLESMVRAARRKKLIGPRPA